MILMTIKTVHHILAGDFYAGVRAANARLRQLQSAADDACGAHGIDCAGCRIAGIRQGELRLAAADAAQASRLRQILPTLLRAFNQIDSSIRTVAVSIPLQPQ